MRIRPKFVRNLTKEELKTLRRLCGPVVSNIFRLPDEPPSSKMRIFIACENGRILGWSMVDTSIVHHEKERAGNPSIYLYVRASERRKGIGTQLFERAYRYCTKIKRKVQVWPWNEASIAFFEKCKQRHRCLVGEPADIA